MASGEKDKDDHLHFFVNGKKYDAPSGRMTGAEIKATVGDWPAGYGLMLEGHGDEENRLINDDEVIHFEKGRPLRFVSVPPATYGA